MDIKISDNWLKEYLDTKASPPKIAECLSLCGPSVERIEKAGDDLVYDIEITTNRIDCASVYGIAREASAILPRFGIPAKLRPLHIKNDSAFASEVSYLNAFVDTKLCQRFSAVLIKNVKIGQSPDFIRKRLEASSIRSLNNLIDISNYIMVTLGQPVHTFDYDKIKGATMRLRESKRGETITTLDDKQFTLPGGDIVIEDGEGRLIDLAGVMGGKLSAVDENTKNVLLFVQTYNPVNIRQTSMFLAQRTVAATIFEKGTDTELVTEGIMMGIDLFEKITGGVAEEQIIDLYPSPYKAKQITIPERLIQEKLGVRIPRDVVSAILKPLGFGVSWQGGSLKTTIPSFRANDVNLPEDVLEEIARIFGYHNLPSEIMTGTIPKGVEFSNFTFERNVKGMLAGWGGTEVYTLSLVPKSYVDQKALKLKNPLGEDSEYLRTSLMPSLIRAAKDNIGTFEKYHLFEMSNVYLPKSGNLPEERLFLAGIFTGYNYREAKGVLEALLEKLAIKYLFDSEESVGFSAGSMLLIKAGNKVLGKFGIVDDSKLLYYELDMAACQEATPLSKKYLPIPKYPPQIEDITFILPVKTRIGEVINSLKVVSPLVKIVELKDTYGNSYTFNIHYQAPNKTLNDGEVSKVRILIFNTIKTRFGGTPKT